MSSNNNNNNNNNLVELKNIIRTYQLGQTQVQALRGVSLAFKKGEFIAIKGPSGSGKSTLMHIIGCLDQPSAGQYFLEGQNVAAMESRSLAQVRSRQIGFVFQSFNLLPRMSAVGNVELPLVYTKTPAEERREIALKMLKSVGLEQRVAHQPSELSGGERQRVAIARALVNNPSIILADEPTGNLDSESGQQIINIFAKLNQEGITVIFVTHEAEVAEHAQRIINLRDGKVVGGKYGPN
ncbi:ABC transporter ATP-binding protein [Candidatus Margulisiibacteriota bacterium]